MNFRTPVLAAIALLSGADAQSQLEFEVASIKPGPQGGGRGGGRVAPAPGGERYAATNTPLVILIAEAWQVKFDQVVGGPDWIRRERYDLNAKAGRPSSGRELRLMLQKLLADRCKLRVHVETREAPAYLMTVDKDNLKLKPSEAADPQFDQSPGAQPHQVRIEGLGLRLDLRKAPVDSIAIDHVERPGRNSP